MAFSRRDFLAVAATSLISTKLLAKELKPGEAETIASNNAELVNPTELASKRILPRALSRGANIAITAPASPTSIYELRNCIRVLKKMDCSIEIGDTIKRHSSKDRYLSAPDEERAAEFMEYINRKDIDCIICGRGGYGTMRILPMMDYEVIKNNPKIIIGFSDITALIIAIHQLTGMVCFHGPVAISSFGEFSEKYFLKVIFKNEEFEPFDIKLKDTITINSGVAEGVLIGGNLSMLVSTLGTMYEFDATDSILFIEEVSEHPYKIDRMLTQLWLAGKLQQAKAVAFGEFKGLNAKKSFYPGGSFTIKQVIESRCLELGIPAIIGLPVGHDKSNITMPLGIKARLDTEKKLLTFLESPVKS